MLTCVGVDGITSIIVLTHIIMIHIVVAVIISEEISSTRFFSFITYDMFYRGLKFDLPVKLHACNKTWKYVQCWWSPRWRTFFENILWGIFTSGFTSASTNKHNNIVPDYLGHPDFAKTKRTSQHCAPIFFSVYALINVDVYNIQHNNTNTIALKCHAPKMQINIYMFAHQ